MKRGEIWTISGGPGYSGKPRPALIVQSDLLRDTGSVVICGLTTHENPVLRVRPPVYPDPGNGLTKPSEVMTDKVMAIPRNKLGERIGALSAADMARVEGALLLVLGFAE